MSRRILISFGCSHSAGSEIDGVGDSDYNRQNSYGAILTKKFGFDRHINYALCGGSNQRIFTLTTQVLSEIINNESKMIPFPRKHCEYFFLIGWTGLNRFDLRYSEDNDYIYHQCGDAGDMVDPKIIPACAGMNPRLIDEVDKRRALDHIHDITDDRIMAEYLASYIFSLQTLFKYHQVEYYMFNAIENFYKTDGFHKDRLTPIHNGKTHMSWRPGNTIIYDNIDTKYYYHPKSRNKNYYRWCLAKGHTNQSNKYWHLGQAAHQDWADHIYPEIINVYPHLE